MRRAIALCLATVLVAGCGDEKKPASAPEPEPEPKQIPGEKKKKGAPGVTHFFLLSDTCP